MQICLPKVFPYLLLRERQAGGPVSPLSMEINASVLKKQSKSLYSIIDFISGGGRARNSFLPSAKVGVAGGSTFVIAALQRFN